MQSVNVPITTTDSCSAIQVDVTTFLACSNYVRGPFSYRVDPNVPLTPIIRLEVNYYSTPNCVGPVSNPVFNFSLMNIPIGSYDLLIFGYLDNVFTGGRGLGSPIVVTPCSSVGVEEIAETNFEVYPNPTMDYLNIKSSTSNYEVNLMDIKGSRIENVQLINKGDLTSIDLSALNSGIYFLEFKSDNEVIVKKIIKQ